MPIDATVTLDRLVCSKEHDGSGHSEPHADRGRRGLFARLLIRLGAALTLSAAAAGAHAAAPVPPDGPSGPPPCTDAATVRFTASPASIVFPAPGTLSLSLVAPAGCSGLQLELNGTIVMNHGSRTDHPPRSTRHALRLLWIGPGQRAVMRTLFANVALSYPEPTEASRCS